MCVEILRQQLRSIANGTVGQLLKNAIPNLDDISDFSANQLYHKDTVVCIKTGDDYRLYKCGYNDTKGKLDPNKWSLHVVHAATDSKLGLYTKKTPYKFVCPEDNTRKIKIEKHNFDSDLHVFDLFVGGTIVDHDKYYVDSGYIVLKDHVRGFPKNKEIIINMYGD